MTNSELSNEFDVLYNNITSNQAPGLNEYEKSVFLTKAQSQLVNEYFNNRTDGFGGGFDGSQKRQYDFSSLTRVANLFEVNTFTERISDLEKLDRRSKVYLFPYNYYLAVNEILFDDAKQYSVIPITHTEYQRLMLKPYSLPVKKAAWRMFTDKKNCNYCRELANPAEKHEADYVIMSSWADQKRNLSVNIYMPEVINLKDTDIKADAKTFNINGVDYTVSISDDAIVFKNSGSIFKIECNGSWKDQTSTYYVVVGLQAKTLGQTTTYNSKYDDEEVMKYIQLGFSLFDKYVRSSKENLEEYEVYKVGSRLDYFQMCSAPSRFENFVKEEGKTFITKIIQVPMAEIIGKFNNIPTYQLRYIKTLNPIILEDLSDYGEDISIDGIDTKSECELPEETHQEILERAVTLAKIAWQGGTMTQAQTKE